MSLAVSVVLGVLSSVEGAGLAARLEGIASATLPQGSAACGSSLESVQCPGAMARAFVDSSLLAHLNRWKLTPTTTEGQLDLTEAQWVQYRQGRGFKAVLVWSDGPSPWMFLLEIEVPVDRGSESKPGSSPRSMAAVKALRKDLEQLQFRPRIKDDRGNVFGWFRTSSELAMGAQYLPVEDRYVLVGVFRPDDGRRPSMSLLKP